jgi:hypothetical protein
VRELLAKYRLREVEVR